MFEDGGARAALELCLEVSHSERTPVLSSGTYRGRDDDELDYVKTFTNNSIIKIV